MNGLDIAVKFNFEPDGRMIADGHGVMIYGKCKAGAKSKVEALPTRFYEGTKVQLQ